MVPLRFALLATLAAWGLASTDAAVSQKRLQAGAVDQGAKVQRVDESADLVPGTTDVTSPVLGSTSPQPDSQQEQEQQPLRTSGQGRHPDTVR